MKKMEKWFEIGGWNIQAQYAYGTETEAQHYADVCNESKNINFVSPKELSDAEAAELGLENNTEAFNLDDWARDYAAHA